MAHHRKYAVNGSQNIASPDDSILGITATTAVEPSINHIGVGPEDTPADASVVWKGQRHTAAGTATAVTPTNLGPGTTASTTTAGENHTAEPTYTAGAVVFRLGLNLRSSHSVIFDPETCLTVPATANNGITFFPTHASQTVLMGMMLYFHE